MTIIVRHKETQDLYVVVGTGHSSQWKQKHTAWGRPLNEWGPALCMTKVILCAEDGLIRKANAHELVVVSIDGKPLRELLGAPSYRGYREWNSNKPEAA